MARAGRPWKYRHLVAALPDDTLFTASGVIAFCDQAGMFATSFDYPGMELDYTQRRQLKKNARKSLESLIPRLGVHEGLVEQTHPYQAFYRAWFGRTWKAVLLAQKQA